MALVFLGCVAREYLFECEKVAPQNDLIALSDRCKPSFLRLRFHFIKIFLSLFLSNFGECPGGELTYELWMVASRNIVGDVSRTREGSGIFQKTIDSIA